MKHWQCKKSELVFQSPYFKVRKDTVKLPSGELKEWFYWDQTDSAMVIGMTKEKKLLMIKQYRYLTKGEMIEFPSGALEKGEDIETGARREFLEETGYQGKTLVKIGSFYETCAQLNRQIHLFFAPGVVKVQEIQDNEIEDIKLVLTDYKKAVEWALQNKILSTPSALAILLLKEKIERGEIRI